MRNIPLKRKWQPTLVFLPGKPHGQRNLAGCRPWGCKESDTTENTHTQGKSKFFFLFFVLSVQFSCSVVSNSLRPHESQHARPPCPSPTPGVHSDWRPSSQWCHPAISSSVVPFSSCPPIPPSIRVFSNESTLHMFGQSTGVSALASFLPQKSQGWSPSEWTGWISCSPRDSQGSLPTPLFRSTNLRPQPPLCYFGCNVFMPISVCPHGQTKLEQKVLLCVIQGLQQRSQCLFTQSYSWLKGKSLDHENLSSPSSGLRAPGTPVLKASIPGILHTCLQPSSWTHSALVSLRSKCLAVWRSSCLRK